MNTGDESVPMLGGIPRTEVGELCRRSEIVDRIGDVPYELGVGFRGGFLADGFDVDESLRLEDGEDTALQEAGTCQFHMAEIYLAWLTLRRRKDDLLGI